MATIQAIPSDLGGATLEAACLATDTQGDFVYITGDPASGVHQVTKVVNTNSAHFPAIGVIIAKSSDTKCTVQRFGIVDVSLWSSPPTLTSNSNYWIGFDSKLSPTPPVPLSGISVVQLVGKAISPTELLMVTGGFIYKLNR